VHCEERERTWILTGGLMGRIRVKDRLAYNKEFGWYYSDTDNTEIQYFLALVQVDDSLHLDLTIF
jgi:hypothetical protein